MCDVDETLLDTFFSSNSYSENTCRLYTLILDNYRNYHKMNLEDLIEEAETEEEKGIKRRKRKINSRVLKWKKYLETDCEFSYNSIKSYVNTVINFYDFNDIAPPKIKTKKGEIGLEQNKGRLMKREEIRKMADAGDARARAVIYTLALTGISQAELRRITIDQIMRGASDLVGRSIRNIEDLLDTENELKNEILSVYITRDKVHHTFFMFLPAEALRPIFAYIRERLYSENENVRPTPGSVVFVKDNGDPITDHALRDVIVSAGESAGFKRVKEGAYAWWRGHALRKYFISTVKNKTGNSELAEWLAGHKPRDTDETYWYKDVEDIKEQYIVALEYLSIDEIRIKDFESKEYKEVMKSLSGVSWVLDLLDEDAVFREAARDALKRRKEFNIN